MHIRTYKNAYEKENTFSRITKNKTDKNGFCVNSPLVSKHFNFASKKYAIKIFSALKMINLLFIDFVRL